MADLPQRTAHIFELPSAHPGVFAVRKLQTTTWNDKLLPSLSAKAREDCLQMRGWMCKAENAHLVQCVKTPELSLHHVNARFSRASATKLGASCLQTDHRFTDCTRL